MNVNISNIDKGNKTLNINKDRYIDNSFLEVGKVFSATITKKTNDYIQLNTNGIDFNLPHNAVVGEQGDKIDLEVTSLSDNQVKLKQLGLNQDVVAKDYNLTSKSSDDIIEMFKQNNLLSDIDPYTGQADDELKKQETIRKIQSQLRSTSNNTSSYAIKELIKNGISLNNISISMLSEVTTELDAKPIKLDEQNDKLINELRLEFEDEFKSKDANKNNSIIKSLIDNGLKINKDTINQVENTINKLDAVDDKSLLLLLKNNEQPTISNLYKNTFKTTVNNDNSDRSYNDLKNLYKELSNKLEVTYNKSTEKMFKEFLDLDIDITKENVQKINELKTLVKSVNKDDLLDAIAKSIKNNSEPQNINVIDLKSNKVDQTKEQILNDTLETIELLPKLSRQNIQYLAHNNDLKTTTLNDVKEAIQNNYALNSPNNTELLNNKKANDEVLFLRNIYSISIRLTYTSAYKMSMNNIDINTKPMEEALNELTNIDQQSYIEALNKSNLETTKENIGIINQTYQGLYDAYSVSSLSYKSIIFNDGSFNIASLKNGAMSKKALDGYEIFETKTGVNFKEIREQISPLLEDMQLKPTQKNIRAVEILIKNNMDITHDNINIIKSTDIKLDKLIDELNPKAIVSIMEEGKNPLNMDIDEILDFAQKFNDTFMVDTKEKVESQILEMQKNNSYDKDTMDAIKAIYRVINKVIKNDNIALGTLINANHDLTLGNLLDSAKYIDKTKNKNSYLIDAVGDETKQLLNNDKSIKNIVETVSSRYNELLLNQLAEEATVSGLNEVINNNKNYNNELLEDVITSLKEINKKSINQEIDNSVLNDMVKSIENTLNIKAPELAYLISNNVQLSINNLKSFKELNAKPHDTSDNLKAIVNNKNSNIDKSDFVEINESLVNTLAEEGSLLDVTIGSIDFDFEPIDTNLIQTKNTLINQLEFLNSFNKSPNSNVTTLAIKLPLSDEVTTVNMFVIDENYESKATKKIALSLKLDNLGEFNGLLSISNDKAQLDVNSDNDLSGLEDELKQLISELGYDEVIINFNTKYSNNIFSNELNA